MTVAPPIASAGAGYLLLPLSEFGQSLDSPDLDCWFEGFAGRNRAQAEYEITARGDLKIMPPTGFPFDLYEARATIRVGVWADDNGGLAGGPTSRFIMPERLPARPRRLVDFRRALAGRISRSPHAPLPRHRPRLYH